MSLTAAPAPELGLVLLAAGSDHPPCGAEQEPHTERSRYVGAGRSRSRMAACKVWGLGFGVTWAWDLVRRLPSCATESVSNMA